jgi:phospholipid-binding lipoprotein MlaA
MHSNQQRRHGRQPAACALAAVLLAHLCGCATGPNRNPADPLEPLNRGTARFNDALDRNIFQPVARTYNRAVPSPIRTGVGNFFSNLGDVTVMFNDFAQLRLSDGMNDLMRIAVNSTFGLLGVIDIATPAGIAKRDQDFGLTLGHYGMSSGPYLVLPLFGPSTFRDAAGFGVDLYIAPVSHARPAVRNTLWGIDFVSSRARYLNVTDLLEQAALDRYLFMRDAYLGRRRFQLNEGKEQPLPDYGSENGSGNTGGKVGANRGHTGAPSGQAE